MSILCNIYNNCFDLGEYLQDHYIEAIVCISNNQEYNDFRIFKLVKTFLKLFENTNIYKSYKIMSLIDVDFYFLLLESDNYKSIGYVLDIISICSNIFPNYFREISFELWGKLILNYNNYPLENKSKIINCLAFLLNPNLKLSNDILFDPNLVEIISDHLHHQIFEDCVNLLFILQTLIYINNIKERDKIKRIVKRI